MMNSMTWQTLTRARNWGGVLCAAILAALAVGFASEQAAPKRSAKEVIEHVALTVTQLLNDEAMSMPQKRRGVMDLVHTEVDFKTISKLALARNYRKFSAEQRKEFEYEFERHVVNTYWKNASSVSFERIDITRVREEKGGDWTIKTEIISGSDETRMDYRMRLRTSDEKAAPEYKIIDIIIEGVSLVSNFRSQFQGIVSSNGAEHLLKLLRKKNAETEAAEKAAEES